MSAPLFGDEWISKSQKDHDAAHAKFQAAVTSAMSNNDDSIKMVSSILVFWILVVLVWIVFWIGFMAHLVSGLFLSSVKHFSSYHVSSSDL
jgi:hypothetical protein